MHFTTPISIPTSEVKIGYQDGILMLGSCFSDEISRLLEQCYFQVTANPYGTLYNPLSIADAMQNMGEIQLIEHNGLWHSMRHHGEYSTPSYDETMRRCMESVHRMATSIHSASVIVITFGTAYVYEKDGQVVANCHKLPADCFTRRLLTAEEIARIWTPILHQYNDKQFIFTVSPIRHIKDGLHANSISKSILLQAVDLLVSNATNANYFPSWEIMMDELRDYRFYADDLVHPSTMAVQYIFERFIDTYMTEATKTEMRPLHQLWLDSHHRLLHPDSAESKAFTERIVRKREELSTRYPWITDQIKGV